MYSVHLSLGNKLFPVSVTTCCFNVSPMTFSKGKHKIQPPGRNNPRHQDTTQANVSKAALQIWPWESWWTSSWPWASIGPLQQRWPAASQAASGNTASRAREVILPFAQHRWHTKVRNAVSSVELPSTREMRTSWSKSSKRLQRWLRDWSYRHTKERLRAVPVQLWWKESLGEHMPMYKQNRRRKDDGARLL